MNRFITITRNIEFGDVDLTGAMWHGSYARYYEAARCRLLDFLGFSYETILSNGYQIPVISMQMRYIHPCRYNQKVEITATIKPSIRMLIIEYEMRDSESHLKLSTAETKHLAFSNEKQSALFKLPNFMLKKLGEINE